MRKISSDLLEIITDTHILKLPCSIVRQSEIRQLKTQITWMKDFILQNNGLGLAAPQIGLLKTFFVMLMSPGTTVAVFNPIILRKSEDTIEWEELCFSCPGVTKITHRPREIKVRYYDSFWKEKKKILKDRDAIVFAHELDHLNGVLISD